MFMRLVLGLDVYLATIVLLTITGIYTITGGFAAVVYTDILHAIVMVLGSILVMGFAFQEVGGYKELLYKYPGSKPNLIHEGNWTAKPECFLSHLDFFHIFFPYPITGDFPWPGMSLASLPSPCTTGIFVQRCLAGKNMSHVKGGCVLCGYLKLLPMFSIVMPGMISQVLFPDKVACVVPSICKNYCAGSPGNIPSLPGIRGLMLSALWASLMSSLTSIFNCASALFTMDIYNQIRPMVFVIILLAVTIMWVPVIQTEYSEQLFEYTHAVMSYLTPPIAAISLLVIFCKRITEQGAFWGLTRGLLIGFSQMLSEFAYGPWSCEANSKCPLIICSVHHLYFAVIPFIISFFTITGTSLFTDLIPDKHLHRLCWSLRDSQDERIDLNAEIQGKRPTPRAQPGEKEDPKPEAEGCLWKMWDVFCGLEPQPGPKLAPKEVAEESMEKYDDMSEIPFWREIANASGFLLISTIVLLHIYYY
uniref:Sodium/glucose cotransporter 1-like n=1 Tax=Canis lupus familiaris TaxID=9615 RepID=A0A8C0SXV0_CANLF